MFTCLRCLCLYDPYLHLLDAMLDVWLCAGVSAAAGPSGGGGGFSLLDGPLADLAASSSSSSSKQGTQSTLQVSHTTRIQLVCSQQLQ